MLNKLLSDILIWMAFLRGQVSSNGPYGIAQIQIRPPPSLPRGKFLKKVSILR